MKFNFNEARDLMGRMGLITESQNINEVSCKWRDVVGEESFFDLLSAIPDGRMVTFGYVSSAKIEVPKGHKMNPVTKRPNQFDDYAALGKNLGEEGNLVNIIKLTIYNLPWQSQDKISKQYSDFKKKRDEIGDKYGVQFGTAKYGTSTNNFGTKGGIQQYAGNNADLSTHTYSNFNMSGIKPLSTEYYMVMDNGDLRPISIDRLTLLPYKPKDSAIDKLRAAGATDADIQPLLNMQYQRFEHSHVLFVSATPDTGIPTLLINNKLSDKIGGISGVKTENIIKLAQDRYTRFTDKDVRFEKSMA